jgi:hypothetical protein
MARPSCNKNNQYEYVFRYLFLAVQCIALYDMVVWIEILFTRHDIFPGNCAPCWLISEPSIQIWEAQQKEFSNICISLSVIHVSGVCFDVDIAAELQRVSSTSQAT